MMSEYDQYKVDDFIDIINERRIISREVILICNYLFLMYEFDIERVNNDKS